MSAPVLFALVLLVLVTVTVASPCESTGPNAPRFASFEDGVVFLQWNAPEDTQTTELTLVYEEPDYYPYFLTASFSTNDDNDAILISFSTTDLAEASRYPSLGYFYVLDTSSRSCSSVAPLSALMAANTRLRNSEPVPEISLDDVDTAKRSADSSSHRARRDLPTVKTVVGVVSSTRADIYLPPPSIFGTDVVIQADVFEAGSWVPKFVLQNSTRETIPLHFLIPNYRYWARVVTTGFTSFTQIYSLPAVFLTPTATFENNILSDIASFTADAFRDTTPSDGVNTISVTHNPTDMSPADSSFFFSFSELPEKVSKLCQPLNAQLIVPVTSQLSFESYITAYGLPNSSWVMESSNAANDKALVENVDQPFGRLLLSTGNYTEIGNLTLNLDRQKLTNNSASLSVTGFPISTLISSWMNGDVSKNPGLRLSLENQTNSLNVLAPIIQVRFSRPTSTSVQPFFVQSLPCFCNVPSSTYSSRNFTLSLIPNKPVKSFTMQLKGYIIDDVIEIRYNGFFIGFITPSTFGPSCGFSPVMDQNITFPVDNPLFASIGTNTGSLSFVSSTNSASFCLNSVDVTITYYEGSANGIYPPICQFPPAPTPSPTQTPSATPSNTLTPTPSRTGTPSISLTATPSVSPIANPSQSSTPSRTASQTGTPTPSSTRTPSRSLTASPSTTPSLTPTRTASRTISITSSPSSPATPAMTISASRTSAVTPSVSASITQSATPTSSVTPAVTPSPSTTSMPTSAPTRSQTPSSTFVPSNTATSSNVPTQTGTPASTPGSTPSSTMTPSQTLLPVFPTPTPSASPSATSPFTPSSSKSAPPSPSPVVTFSPTTSAGPVLRASSTQSPFPSVPPISNGCVLSNCNTLNQTIPVRGPVSNATILDSRGDTTGTVVIKGTNNAATIRIENVDDDLLRRAQPVVFQSVVFNITLVDTLGQDVQPESALICLETSGGEDISKQCLGFLDESDPAKPEWKCQDECLQKGAKGKVCGTSSHFTSFAILLSGSVGSDPCGDNSSDFFTGAYWSDSVVVAVIAAFILFLFIFSAIVLTFTKPGRAVLYGKEGLRIKRLHTTRSELAEV
eukprot:TRINITY_DN670_c0_g1_i2.p1 TRINITY_DN670_c0_g1~~TRINITY_DN670_c0_g1_i2.p1  ORF type:complete len:1080 (+),score=387.12 TRINITY_DN670_c0_g1_i2:165-3404(+)